MFSSGSHKLKPLLLGFVLSMIVLLLAQSWGISYQLSKVAQISQHEHQFANALIQNMKDVRFHVVQIQQFLTDVSATGDRDGFSDAKEHYGNAVSKLQKLAEIDPQHANQATEVQKALDIFYQTGQKMAEAYITQGQAAGNSWMKQPQSGFDDRAEQLTKHLETLQAGVEKETEKIIQESQSEIEASRNLLLGSNVTLIALVLLGGWLQYRRVFHTLGGEPIDVMRRTADIAAGDLRQPTGQSEYQQKDTLFAALFDMQTQLRKMVGHIDGSSKDMREHADVLSKSVFAVQQASHTQSEASRGIAVAVEEVLQSITQLANQMHAVQLEAQDADNAVETCAGFISGTAGNVQHLAEEILASSLTLDNLQAQANTIVSITQTIHDIADQTNLLALNAAIESARAGEVGRGFAVVADEVRKLAEKTSSATVDISRQIQVLQSGISRVVSEMKNKVSVTETSVAQSQQATQSILGVKQNAESIRVHLDSIGFTLTEQKQAIQDIAQRAEVISTMTESNQMSIDQTAQGANALNQNAQSLQLAVSAFKL